MNTTSRLAAILAADVIGYVRDNPALFSCVRARAA